LVLLFAIRLFHIQLALPTDPICPGTLWSRRERRLHSSSDRTVGYAGRAGAACTIPPHRSFALGLPSAHWMALESRCTPSNKVCGLWVHNRWAALGFHTPAAASRPLFDRECPFSGTFQPVRSGPVSGLLRRTTASGALQARPLLSAFPPRAPHNGLASSDRKRPLAET
jgi:hypothetical protein